MGDGVCVHVEKGEGRQERGIFNKNIMQVMKRVCQYHERNYELFQSEDCISGDSPIILILKYSKILFT